MHERFLSSVRRSSSMQDDAKEARAPLLAPHAALDWRGRPARRPLGGWKCSLCFAGAIGLGSLSFYGVIYNLVIYLVQVCGLTNAAAAYTVSNLTGTTFVCSFLGAIVGDAYVGRFWTALIFQIAATVFYGLINSSVIVLSQGSGPAFATSFLLVSLYLMSISSGPTMPVLSALGADQLSASEDIEKYFGVLAMMVSIGQLLAVTVVTYVDDVGLWVWGFGLCTATYIASIALIAGGAHWFLQYRASGNPFLRNMPVLVAAWRKRSLPVPMDSSLFHECEGDLSAIPGQRKLKHTSTLGCLDKAAILGLKETFNLWHLCTVTQVEELKRFVRVLPAGIVFALSYAANTQISTLFEEQASVMNRQVATWLAIPPASLNVVAIGSAILTGIVIMAGESRLRAWCIGRGKRRGRAQKVASLQLLGAGIAGSIVAMALAALVEGHRLSQAQAGACISVVWLMPQTVLLGVCDYLLRSSGLDFFYSEVSESMRAVSGSMQFIFIGVGNYVSSVLVSLITVITTQGGQAGWIADDLDEAHLDYFYWFLACCLAMGLGIHAVYAQSYVSARGTSAEDPSNTS